MDESEETIQARERMVHDQMMRRDIKDPRVLDAFRTIPRHLFVPADERHLAYVDSPLPIGESQTISQPYIVALMTQLLELGGTEVVLEVGTGSGYQAAILAQLSAQVYSLERKTPLARRAQEVLKSLSIENVEVIERDGSGGLPEYAPYQAIVVTAAAPQVPDPLRDQLDDGGRLVIPVGSRFGQILERWIRRGGKVVQEQLVPVAFVPLIGEHGWDRDETPGGWWRSH